MRTGDGAYATDVLEHEYEPPNGPGRGWPLDPDAAPLRTGPLWERILRVAGAVVVTLYLALFAYDGLRQPRVVDSGDGGSLRTYELLLRDANAGRVARVDVREHHVRWQNRDGAVYQSNYSGYDFRAAVERQPYVQRHPGSVTYGPIERRVHGELRENLGGWLLVVALLVALGRRAYPRHATRWGWAWPLWSFAGIPLYLLFSGSWFRTEPPPPAGRERWRLGGVQAFVAVFVAAFLVGAVGEKLYEDRHPIRPYGEFVEPAEREPFLRNAPG